MTDELNNGESPAELDSSCYLCNEPTQSLAGNPLVWPIWMPYYGGNGEVRCYHTGCVINELSELSQLRADNERLRDALRNLMARIFRDGGQKASTFTDDVEAADVAEAEVVTLLARIDFLREGKEVAAEKLERLRDALREYANPENWYEVESTRGGEYSAFSSKFQDGWAIAREALR